jgi:hypothetical protein
MAPKADTHNYDEAATRDACLINGHLTPGRTKELQSELLAAGSCFSHSHS